MVELYEKLDFKIKTKDKTSVFPIVVKLELDEEDKKSYEAFSKEQEEKDKEIKASSKTSVEISKKIQRLIEDLSDLTFELSDEDLKKKEKKKLIGQRRTARRELRALEDEQETISKMYSKKEYKETAEAIIEEVAKKAFELNVESDEKSQALVHAIEEHGLKYSVVVTELNRLIMDAKKKKKRRS
ncbi:MAG: hypothetical protein DRI37_06370 [Chloroflexi bacterium]|nr:MAG: hypothetical protein DRI37_06370 [Chloroflexota bacterium]